MSLQFKTVKKNEQKSFIEDLEEAVSRGTPESRARALWHTTDLMIAGHFSDDEIWTFGEVVSRLADEIEVAARTQLSERLARFDQAPVNIIHKLAFDDAAMTLCPQACPRPGRASYSAISPTRRLPVPKTARMAVGKPRYSLSTSNPCPAR